MSGRRWLCKWMVHIPFLIFSFSSLLTSKLQLYIPESITFLNCQCNVFWPCVAIIIAAAIKKNCSYRNNCGIRLHAGDLEHSLKKEKKIGLYMFFFSFLCSAISDLDLWILKMLMCVFLWCITTRILLICSWDDMTLSQFVQ